MAFSIIIIAVAAIMLLAAFSISTYIGLRLQWLYHGSKLLFSLHILFVVSIVALAIATLILMTIPLMVTTGAVFVALAYFATFWFVKKDSLDLLEIILDYLFDNREVLKHERDKYQKGEPSWKKWDAEVNMLETLECKSLLGRNANNKDKQMI